jgi:hypothetical protein
MDEDQLKKERRKLGNKMVLEINAIFPDKDLKEIAEAIKKADFQMEVAVGYLMDSQAKMKSAANPPANKPIEKAIEKSEEIVKKDEVG